MPPPYLLPFGAAGWVPVPDFKAKPKLVPLARTNSTINMLSHGAPTPTRHPMPSKYHKPKLTNTAGPLTARYNVPRRAARSEVTPCTQDYTTIPVRPPPTLRTSPLNDPSTQFPHPNTTSVSICTSIQHSRAINMHTRSQFMFGKYHGLSQQFHFPIGQSSCLRLNL